MVVNYSKLWIEGKFWDYHSYSGEGKLILNLKQVQESLAAAMALNNIDGICTSLADCYRKTTFQILNFKLQLQTSTVNFKLQTST